MYWFALVLVVLLVLENVQTEWVVQGEDENEDEDEWSGSGKRRSGPRADQDIKPMARLDAAGVLI